MNPQEAIESYIDAKKSDVSDATIQNYSYRLERLGEFLKQNDVDDISELTPEMVNSFKQKRLSHSEVGPYTVRQQLRTVRDFLRWLEHKEVLEETVSNSVAIPNSDTEGNATDPMDPEKAEGVIDWLVKYKYASKEHVIFQTMWETGIRVGTLRAFDVSDWDSYGKFLTARHRPNTGTPLRDGRKGERRIPVSDDLAEALEDWIEINRPKVTDDYGREPLISTTHGRASGTTVRNTIQKVVQPCRWDNNCPHGEDVSTCEYRKHDNLAGCPSSENTRTVRKGSRLDALD
jgi:site-specific recombinase XerC